jgi:DNA-binding NarL/FixJ family response regulator
MAILAETLVLVGAPDSESVLREAGEWIEHLEKESARAQLLRARGLLLMRRGESSAAVDVLETSAAMARSQRSLVQLGRTLAVLADAVRPTSKTAAAAVRAERSALLQEIGMEVRGLNWARDVRLAVRPPADKTGAMPLSPRERQVARLIARGYSDRQIAQELVITEGTAGVHVSHILNKLGFHTRAEIASWASQHGLLG